MKTISITMRITVPDTVTPGQLAHTLMDCVEENKWATESVVTALPHTLTRKEVQRVSSHTR